MENKKRLIDANATKTIIQKEMNKSDFQQFKDVMQCVCDILDYSDTVDAVEVVRCKDCELWLPEEPERCKAMKSKPYGLCNRYPQRTAWQDTTYEDDFCSYGGRKDNEKYNR